MNENKLTIITPTLNAIKHIQGLVESLNHQTSQDFIWLVVDGGSTDGTLDYIQMNAKFHYKIINSKDYSIYHATNNGVIKVETIYYAVSGADDRFALDFVSLFQDYQRQFDFDFLFGAVETKKGILKPGENKGWLYGMHGVGSSHSIGSIIKVSLHDKYGLYSKMFPVVADQYFIKKCIYGGAIVQRCPNVFGFYSQDGFSSSNKIHYQLDFFKMQILTEKKFILQLFLFLVRLFKLKITH